jgi:phage tail P2-like protein
MNSLLPNNATPQETALELATARIGDVPVPVKDVWNPDTCPADLLPWLAWAFSVDVWSNKWSEAQKRGAIKASYAVHNRKGTAGALRSGLSGIGYAADVVEWFEETPPAPPYTFAIFVEVDQVGIGTIDELAVIAEIAEAYKNARSHFTGLAIRAITRGVLTYGAAVFSGETVTIQAEPSIA